jgi:3-deoxy-D-manno-octulosonic-acid transferase
MALVVWAALVPFELVRVALGLSTLDDLIEHLGAQEVPPKRRDVRLLVHGVSVGETAAAMALVEQIRHEIAGCDVVLTSGSREGRRATDRYRAQFPEIELCSFLPWDRAGAIRGWLERLHADAVVIVETEIWPHLFQSCRDLGIPLFIVSGRLSPGDVGRYRLARRFFQEVLAAVQWIGVQSPRERDAFVRIGAAPDRVEVVGNIKFDAPRRPHRLPDHWRAALEQGAPLVVAGSTHPPEERLVLEALRQLRPDFPRLRVVLTPRRPARAGRVRRLAERHGFRATVWSAARSPELMWDVLIVDRMGWLSELYRYADVVFIGGTLSRRGGHNILEAAAHARAAVIGPHVAHIRETVGELERDGAILCLRAGSHRSDLAAAGAVWPRPASARLRGMRRVAVRRAPAIRSMDRDSTGCCRTCAAWICCASMISPMPQLAAGST